MRIKPLEAGKKIGYSFKNVWWVLCLPCQKLQLRFCVADLGESRGNLWGGGFGPRRNLEHSCFGGRGEKGVLLCPLGVPGLQPHGSAGSNPHKQGLGGLGPKWPAQQFCAARPPGTL